ncbi:glycosyl transferase group 1 [Clostridium gasigenes]|uniref:glycosyl transferase group 1 n=1 Tax=Clostridium gasigenes TaxID=94869 RepID=UPI001C0D8653|nr:glycosyl transferase group 1 [Clostridium gasigenes]MBU3134969.1 glycosyl transferase group 1 [Clostridium gasigenes]
MKILFIACYSPLINNSASIETLQYLNNLAKIKDNEVHLLTVNFPRESIYYDEYILGMLDKRVKLHIISGGKLFEKIMPKKSINSEEKKARNKYSNIKKLLRLAKRILGVPDMYLYWAYKASKYGKELMENEMFNVIFSMHEPPSSHICAYNIKKENKNVTWVTYWSDPWLKDSTREDVGFVRKKIEGYFEKNIISLSDKFVFVTEANRDDYILSYKIPKEKTYLITRGYDDKTYREIEKEDKPELIKENSVNIVYTGEIFSKLRDIKPFINALDKIKKKDIILYNKLNVLFFGNIDDNNIKEELKSIEVAKVSNRIPYKDALGYMVKADILLLFGNKNSKQIPAKIYDYFGCSSYVLVILGDEDDPIITVVENLEKCSVILNNEEDIVNGLIDLVNKIDSGIISEPIKEYEWENISKKLNKILST